MGSVTRGECKTGEAGYREWTQQMASLITNCINKDLQALVETIVKREFSTVGRNVARTISPAIEKAVFVAIAEAFQKGVGDKAVHQLEKSVNLKIEATEKLKSSLVASVIPAFEMSCKAMFEQVAKKGMIHHATEAQQQFESALRDAINSASSKFKSSESPTQLSNGPLDGLHDKIEAPLDPTKELFRLVSERKYEEAFTAALQRSDVSILSWLCSQVDLQRILVMVPLPLSQEVLLSLLQQLACDISKNTTRKLVWMTEVAVALNPTDPMIAVHVRPIFNAHLHPEVILIISSFHIYLGLEILLGTAAAVAQALLGIELEPHFNAPYLSTSLQDFWGRRWNLVVAQTLRHTVYDPILGVSARFMGRKWASLPAVMCTFLVSALMHELIFYYLGRMRPTWELTWFFLLHGACLVVEIAIKKVVKDRYRLPRVIATPMTVGFVMVTGLWLFLPQLLRCKTDVRSLQEFALLGAFVKDVVAGGVKLTTVQ
ncbi:hypothetical protein Vadar_031933 [Vaccinium darrowii]|uniref:Uncharacterized protein n=1 Tax=Vaccinium darrowii TaxID=229202 RepID=A0ACB7XDQ1_9ERIC|nr:hypothetical protein Vadar_031933 [Vaccinium darrowii]